MSNTAARWTLVAALATTTLLTVTVTTALGSAGHAPEPAPNGVRQAVVTTDKQ
ncbi:hypothetical protein [Kribbella solani]|uniref:Uncharacterized protein n=1 Tax=Kribbella solani TaxID=236067 RepID=A0A841DNQ0_9ACTN|nr:hypothetical protein [Kribbella solani]MBB5980192.1 hypothetical protein [Kribbella solani]MDX2971368.1 hypothetical protein [Kribbella solani]MDX3005448.1 hypothetical protein [Kribbella solani]